MSGKGKCPLTGFHFVITASLAYILLPLLSPHGRHLKAGSSEGMCATSSENPGEGGCLTLFSLLHGFRFEWWSASWVEFRYSLQCSLELWKTSVNLPAVPTLLSIPQFYFFPLKIGTEADEKICCLRNYHTEEWYTCLLHEASSELHKWFSWIPPPLSGRRKASISLLYEEERESSLTRNSEFPKTGDPKDSSSSFFLAMANIDGRSSGRMGVVNWVESSQLTLSKPWGRCPSPIFGKSL